MSGNKVAYFYNDQIGNFYYFKDHPMKPRRIAMAHSLIQTFNLYQKLDIYNDRHATREELLKFHHPDYINYLSNFVSKDILTSRDFMYTNDMMLKT
jgi:histone deacetylase 1/2